MTVRDFARVARGDIECAISFNGNAYPFFVSGAGLLLMSLYVFFPVYYLVAGSLLLFAAVLIRTFGREA